MRDPNRIEPMLEALGELWKQHPDLRLGQLVSNLASVASKDVFYIEDDEIHGAIQRGEIWIDWKSKLDAAPYRSLKCPVDEDAIVVIETQAGTLLTSRAGDLYWYLESSLPVSIRRYRVKSG